MCERERVGLCLDCRHSRTVENRRGKVFYLCRLSRSDPRFPKYPPLPVIRCPGYARREANQEPDDD